MATNNRKKRGSKTSADTNRLIGWLVTYQHDEMGASHEIRSGRTLITSEDDKATAAPLIAIEHTSVAAPHTAMSATPTHELTVQDIFTDSGTFLTKATEKKEEQITGPVQISHGDWLRIGDETRFQVCLIDPPQE